MKLLALTDPTFIPDEAELINSLFREGLVCLHIRKPESDEQELRALISKINPDFLDRISIHQHHLLAEAFGIKRVHFTEKERKATSPEILKNLKSEDFILSTSIHELAEIDNISPFFNYTFFGPVFDSISKVGYKSVLPANFYISDEIKRIPIVGLGGISVDNLKKLAEMNFDGAAVLGTLWNEPETLAVNFRKLGNAVSTHDPNGVAYLNPGLYPGNNKKPMIDKLQFISNQTKDLTHLDSISIALDAGCRWIQLRVKDQPVEMALKTAVEAKNLCDTYQAKLIINDFPFIAKEVGSYGLHLGLNDMPISSARKMVGKEMIIGGTANTLENILNHITEGADYVGLGPFRFTSTKQNLSPIVGLEGYKSLTESLKNLKHSIPLIAIGGITQDDIPEILETGMYGIAISGSIINAANPKNVVYQINKVLC